MDVETKTLGIFVGTAVVTFRSIILKVEGVGTLVALSEVGVISQGVFGKQARPGGHSADDPLGQGLAQLFDASKKSTPQKNELLSEQGVYPKHFVPSGHSSSSPVGQGSVHLLAASYQVFPQKEESPLLHGVFP